MIYFGLEILLAAASRSSYSPTSNGQATVIDMFMTAVYLLFFARLHTKNAF